jgi:hypothetical protein
MAWTNSDTIATTSALIALLVLGATFWGAYLQRRHNVLSLRPFIDITCFFFTNESVRFEMKNGGVGPAFIKNIYIKIDGVRYEVRSVEDYETVVKKLGAEIGGSETEFYVPHGNGALVSGESLVILKFNESSKMAKAFKAAIPRIGIEVKYGCAYENEYTANWSWHRDATNKSL